MIARFFLALCALAFTAHAPLAAQAWDGGGARPVVWTTTPGSGWTIGDGVDRHAEVSTPEQGGDPPALAIEPAPIDEVGYTRSQWLSSSVSRVDQGEAKFRTLCTHGKFGTHDFIVAPGQPVGPHGHEFKGNLAVDENSTYASLRNNPASTCLGGPAWGVAYWNPQLLFELVPHPTNPVTVAVKSGADNFYYTESYTNVSKLYRPLRGLTVILGVDPNDRLNTARLAEIPDGQGWDKTRRYNGFIGWLCVGPGGNIPPHASTTADRNPLNPDYVRQLVNADGSDPWQGACEGYDKELLVSLAAPSCWDGYNLRSPNGRNQWRYPIKHTNYAEEFCPQGWWKTPKLEPKHHFPNGHQGLGIHGHAWRSRLFLSSDRMDPNPANWHPRGSTFHSDWINAADDVTFKSAMKWCVGVTINGDPGQPLTCDGGTISPTQSLLTGASPVPALSGGTPIGQGTDRDAQAAKDAFGPIATGSLIPGPGTIGHDH